VTAPASGGDALFRVLLVCSGEDCAAEYEALGAAAELEALCCDCGLGLQALGWPEEVYEADRPAVRLFILPLGSSPE
jgi:hypothetical protein